MSRRAVLVVLGVAVATIVADLATKAWAEAALADAPVDLGWITLRLSQNTGVAFGLGAGAPTGTVTVVTTLATLLIAWMALRGVLYPPTAGGLLLGGGLGNLLDRIGDHAVTDMLDLGWFPSFNVADVALNIGVGLVLLAALLHREHPLDEGAGSGGSGEDADSNADTPAETEQG